MFSFFVICHKNAHFWHRPPPFRVIDPFAYYDPRISNAVHATCYAYPILDLLMFIILHKYRESRNHALYNSILLSFFDLGTSYLPSLIACAQAPSIVLST
jgi:hypothetical protein